MAGRLPRGRREGEVAAGARRAVTLCDGSRIAVEAHPGEKEYGLKELAAGSPVK